MKLIVVVIFFAINSISVFGQNAIPESIQGELTLKPMAKPYETTGFTVEKDATLIILPGTKIISSSGKDKYCNIVVKGTIRIGEKGPAKCKPVIWEGYSPWVKFIGATVEINSLEITLVNCQFQGDNSGIISNSKFYRDQKAIPYPFIIAVPSKGNLTINDCLIEDQGLEIKTSKFPEDLANLTISKCAFTYTLKQNKDSFFYKKCSINIYAFAYGNKCDSYGDITFTAFDWKLIDSLATEWYIENKELRKTLENSTKLVENYKLQLTSKPNTSFKQAVELQKGKEIKK